MRTLSSDRPWPRRLATALRVVVVLACVWWVVPAAGARPVTAPPAGGIVTICDETHLRAALAGGGTVTFACSGTITLAEQITVATDTTIDGSGQAVTISGNDAVRVFYVDAGVSLNLTSLTIADGYQYNEYGDSRGGGIYNNGTLAVNRSTLSNNHAEGNPHHPGYGGDANGGGIYNNGALTLNQSALSNNHAKGNYDYYSGYVVDANGGGIYNSGVLTVSHSTLSHNHAEGSPLGGDANGGGIYNNGVSTVSQSTFSGNGAGLWGVSGTGGAIYVGEGGALTVSNSTFTGNHASWADGSGGLGGGIYIGGGGTLTVTHSTFAGNIAEYDGGGIFNRGTLTLQNTIVAHSVMATNCFNDFGQVIDGGGNLSYPDTTCPGINADPRLGPLQDNGGPTHTMAPGPGSAAIDNAVDAICAAPPVNGLDQRGIMRPQGPHCDIGAVEQDQPWTPTPTNTPTPTGTPTPTITPTPTNTPTPQGHFFPFVPRGR